MNKTAILFVLLALTALQIDAKKSKKHEPQKEEEKQSEDKVEREDKVEPEDEPDVKSFYPGFAIRIPVPSFGILSNIREHLDNLFSGKQPQGLSDFVPGDKTKLKTTTKSKNSTHGPYKTYTVTQETVSTDNKSSPHVVSKVFKSLTTLDKSKLKGKNGKLRIPSMQFELGPFGQVFGDVKGEKCDTAADCKNPGLYCDAFFGVCKKLLDAGETCTQKDQCNSKGGKYRCTWGRCIANSDEGSPGTFCDSDSECHSSEELSCQEQADISRFTRVCMAKLEEGAVCGNAIQSMFNIFRRSEDLTNVCKKGLVCKTVGFLGHMRCIRDTQDLFSEKSDETKPVEDENSKKETKSNDKKKEDKNKKLKF